MATPTNAVTTKQVCTGLDIEMVRNFEKEADRLMEILGVADVEVLKAGTTLYQYVVTGQLNDAERAEGDEVPLSQYSVTKVPFDDFTPFAYDKLTTGEAILKSGFEVAVKKTDDKMVKHIRAKRLAQFFQGLANGTGSANGDTLQAALAYADAELQNEMEDKGDSAERIFHFVNRNDVADYLATAAITTQTAFGMTYIENFLGVQDVIVTNQIPEKTLYVTPNDNIHIYGSDFAELGKAGLSYQTSANGLLGVSHEPAYNRVSTMTHTLTGMMLLPEVTNYIVKATIGSVSSSS